jgi:hypothetical protein
MSHWARVRIFGIDAKNRACWEGGTDAAAREGVGVRYLDNERDHSVKCWDHPGSKTSVSFSSCEASPWVHSTMDSDGHQQDHKFLSSFLALLSAFWLVDKRKVSNKSKQVTQVKKCL